MTMFKSFADFVERHWTNIAISSGVVLMFAGGVYAVINTPKAMKAIEEKKEEKGEELTTVEKVVAGGKHYILPLGIELAGVAAIGLGVKGKMQALETASAALATAKGVISEYETYRQKVKDDVGAKKEAQIHAEAVKEELEKRKDDLEVPEKQKFYRSTAQKVLMYDTYTHQLFWNDKDSVESAARDFNDRLVRYFAEDGLNFNEWLSEIGEKTAPYFDNVGFNPHKHSLHLSPTSIYMDIPGFGYTTILAWSYDYVPFERYDRPC